MKKHPGILSGRSIRVAVLCLLPFLAGAALAADLGTHKTVVAADDGTVKGTLTLDGKVIPLHHIYARKREAWPADVKELNVDGMDDLSCGIVDVVMTNVPLSAAALTSILQHEYHGSETIRGVCLTFEGAGKHSYVHTFLLASGATKGFGMTQSSGEIKEEHGRVIGAVKCKNEETLEVRVFNISFDTGVRLQYSHSEAEPVPAEQFPDEYVRAMPGTWNVERWVELGCASASGTLSIVERSRPNEFRGMFRLVVKVPGKPDADVEEDVTVTRNGTKVHLEGGEVRGADASSWTRDVLDFELRKGLLVGGSVTDSVVLRKAQDAVTAKPAP